MPRYLALDCQIDPIDTDPVWRSEPINAADWKQAEWILSARLDRTPAKERHFYKKGMTPYSSWIEGEIWDTWNPGDGTREDA